MSYIHAQYSQLSFMCRPHRISLWKMMTLQWNFWVVFDEDMSGNSPAKLCQKSQSLSSYYWAGTLSPIMAAADFGLTVNSSWGGNPKVIKSGQDCGKSDHKSNFNHPSFFNRCPPTFSTSWIFEFWLKWILFQVMKEKRQCKRKINLRNSSIVQA